MKPWPNASSLPGHSRPPMVACAPKTGRSQKIGLLDSIPAPGPHFNRIGCLSLASSPQSAKFKSVLQARMTQRELIAFAGASASVRQNKTNAGSRHRRKGGSSCSTKAPNGKVSDFLNTLDRGLRWGLRCQCTQFVIVVHRDCGTLGQR
jgi:hypothetical protein